MDILSLSTVSEDDGTVVHLKDVSGNPLYDGPDDTKPVVMRIAGTYSARYRKAQKAVRDAQTRAMRRGGSLDGEQIDAAQYELEAACILEWTFTIGTSAYPISPENWRAIAEKQPQWREQVQNAMGDHERFFGQS